MKMEKGKLLRIYVVETDKHDGLPVYEWIIRKAHEEKMAGATVFRGMKGFGSRQHMHTAKVLRLAQDLPVVVEIIDTAPKIDRFQKLLGEALHNGLSMVSEVDICRYSTSTAEHTGLNVTEYRDETS